LILLVLGRLSLIALDLRVRWILRKSSSRTKQRRKANQHRQAPVREESRAILDRDATIVLKVHSLRRGSAECRQDTLFGGFDLMFMDIE